VSTSRREAVAENPAHLFMRRHCRHRVCMVAAGCARNEANNGEASRPNYNLPLRDDSRDESGDFPGAESFEASDAIGPTGDATLSILDCDGQQAAVVLR
jgi:hypothetical protein